MPDRVEIHDVTCTQFTPANAPVEVLFNDAPGLLVKVTIVIPGGHAGLTGIALGYGHQQVLPRTPGAFISGDDEEPWYDMSNYPPGPAWSAFVCNLDLIPHTWEVRLEYNEITGPVTVATPTAIAPAAILAQVPTLVSGS